MKILFLFLFVSLSAFAQELYYLKPESVDLTKVPAPPVLNSSEDLADLEEVFNAQNLRSEADCKRAAHEEEGFATSFFGSQYGPLTDEQASKLVEFQERLFNEVNFYSRILKNSYARTRPSLRDERIKPCVRQPRSLSYPSGHSAAAYLASRTFALIYPEKSEALFRRAEMISYGRVVGGVHHPMDTVAGKALGKEVFEALMKDENFLKDVETLKQ